VTLRAAIKTVGCRLNQAESATIAAGFEAAGYRIVPFGQPCEVCVIHSCSVTARAERTSVRLARSAGRGPGRPRVVLAGCAAELDPRRLRAASGADLVAGQRDKFRLPELLRADPGATAGATSHPRAGDRAAAVPLSGRTRALVKAQDGCGFGCAYCVVPLARGPAASRPFDDVVREARDLVRRGYRECVLTGANLGCYADAGRNLVRLLAELASLPGLDRIRLSSIELSTVERAVVDFMATCPKVCRYLHIPMQSGDDRILSAMGRRYTAAQFRDLLSHAASRLAPLGLGTDVIVGFPGEDEAAFEATMRMARDLPFTNLHVFPFSRRPGTRAATMPGQVPEAEKRRRVAAVIALGRAKKEAFARGLVGRPVSVLVERVTRRGGKGWTAEYVPALARRSESAVNALVSFVPGRVEGGVLVQDPGPGRADAGG
jgi:threonylcarbamoyladenosine tRNA methylthiotransferase MtaB